MIAKTTKKFPMGQVVATPGAINAMNDAGDHPNDFLFRHATGDWGEVPREDAELNDLAVIEDSRILSAYFTKSGVKLWIITEVDRSSTTILLPEEY